MNASTNLRYHCWVALSESRELTKDTDSLVEAKRFCAGLINNHLSDGHDEWGVFDNVAGAYALASADVWDRETGPQS